MPGVGTPPAGARDDVGFLEAVLTTATSALCAVPTRVYGTWYSGGGRMRSAAACARPHQVAAIAPVAGLRAGPRSAEPRSAQPVVVRAGPAGPGHRLPRPAGRHQPLPVRRQRRLALPDPGRPGPLGGDQPLHPGPAAVSVTTHVTRTSYPNCAADTVLYTISDGGHTGPGTRAASLGNGTTTPEISANT